MEPSIDLKLRVILVTTRAALRHADHDPAQRRDIVERGRALVATLASEEADGNGPALARALVELDRLAEG